MLSQKKEKPPGTAGIEGREREFCEERGNRGGDREIVGKIRFLWEFGEPFPLRGE